MYLISEIYRLTNKPLAIANVMNFSLVGKSREHLMAPVINCTKRGFSFLAITNSSAITCTIENIRLINCGAKVEKSFAKNFFPNGTTAAALFLYNASSISVKNVMFFRSYSHAIVGLNQSKCNKHKLAEC